MIVKELIKKLKKFDGNKEVKILSGCSIDYADVCSIALQEGKIILFDFGEQVVE